MISSFARVSAKATLGRDVTVGDFTIIHDNVHLGDGVVIESHCVIGHPTPLAGGEPLVIGDGAHVRSHSILYEGSVFGERLVTGHRATLREKIKAGKHLQVGTLCDFQGHTTFGDYVRTHSNVFIAQFSAIGSFVWIFPHAVFTNDPHPPSDGAMRGVTVEDYAAIAARACILPGVRVGTRALVAAQSLVTRDVPPDMVVAGVPAKVLGPTSQVKLRDGSGRAAYPWMRHFHRGYPAELVAEWKKNYGSL